jgi:gamma-butyrobetaine dioxygenase
VHVSVDGTKLDFSALLLRDLCHCPSCVHESSRQRLYSTAQIPPDIQARTVDVSPLDSESVRITWDNDGPGFDETHETRLRMDVLRSLKNVGAMSGPFQDALEAQVLWARDDYDLPDTDFEGYVDNDAALYAAMKQLRTHGLVFVTGIPDNDDALTQIARRIGPMKDTFYGHTWDGKWVDR